MAVNLYYGVFSGEISHCIDDIDARVRAPTEQRLRTMTGEVGGKPILVTEFGNIGIKGLRGAVGYTEDHQARYNQAVWQAISSVPGVAGGVLWCWADYYQRYDMVGFAARSLQAPFGIVTVDRMVPQTRESGGSR